MLTTPQVELIQNSFTAAVTARDDLVMDFYQTLFLKAPSVRGMFKEDISDQSEKLAAILQLAVQKLSDLEALVGPLHALGAQHVEYGAEPGHYTAVAETLVECLARAVGPDWTEDHAAAWNDALTFIAQTMLDGADMAAPRQ
ncbi:globin domain-containing protein [Marivita sp.]|jgi:nitric oxide dioxygenase|uniref:globin domain-containing protein n=1 Tax=Marivita sp. TaxID=2003365 RepID=UPI003F6BE636